MTNKDFIFVSIVVIWLLLNIAAFFMFEDFGVAMSNIICISLLLVMLIFKHNNYRRFGDWLEKRR